MKESLFTKFGTIKDMVKDNKRVQFSFYRDGELWYVTESGFEFPVPTNDVGNATLMASDKAILFMRYIRKHFDSILKAEEEQQKKVLIRDVINTGLFSKENILEKFQNEKHLVEQIFSESVHTDQRVD